MKMQPRLKLGDKLGDSTVLKISKKTVLLSNGQELTHKEVEERIYGEVESNCCGCEREENRSADCTN